ncbi:MAG: sugar phosphate nucleotidyltransferase [Candidatus Ratteibacteria bacterium]|nr:sugar phosphate nucleotidyltransferase [Candidatus Ratteibacteria bacterium]
MDNQIQSIDTVILCGGIGRRLRPLVDDRPKSMAEINHRPFLDILLEYIGSYGFKRVILCIGYMGGMIREHFQKKSVPLEMVYSEEKEPLGTGGALKAAKALIRSKTFMVLNGDSFCRIDFSKFIDFHLNKKALVSLALTKVKQGKNCGQASLNTNNRIIGFKEKADLQDRAYSSVGIYLMEGRIFSLMDKKKKFSLEYDFFPGLINQGCYGYITEESLIDIGTPEDYRKAQKFF